MLWNENIFPFLLYTGILLDMTMSAVHFCKGSVIVVSCSVEYASVCYAVYVDYETVNLETVLCYTYVSC